MKTLAFLIALGLTANSFGQVLTPEGGSYIENTTDAFTQVEAPAVYLYRGDLNTSPTAVLQVTFLGNFPDSAQWAVNRAAEIWSYLVVSTKTIRIDAKWETLQPGILAVTTPDTLFRNFPSAPRTNTNYPVALAEAISGTDLNATNQRDIFIRFRSGVSWSFDLNGTPRSGKVDLVTVALHEIAHGLGYSISFNVDSTGEGGWGVYDSTTAQSYATIYDVACGVGSDYHIMAPS